MSTPLTLEQELAVVHEWSAGRQGFTTLDAIKACADAIGLGPDEKIRVMYINAMLRRLGWSSRQKWVKVQQNTNEARILRREVKVSTYYWTLRDQWKHP